MNCPGTELVYFRDALLFKHEAQVLSFDKSEVKDCTTCVILDSTIFHPQGGGQPSDKGQIFSSNFSFQVLHVTKQGSIVLHHGIITQGKVSPGDRVTLELDREQRILNARLHTAGHALEYPLHEMGFISTIGKGYHFPDSPFVELQSDPPFPSNLDLKDLATKIQTATNEMIQKDLKYTSSLVKFEDVPKYSKRDVSAFANEEFIRIVELEGFKGQGLPCGGTHLPNLGMIGLVVIKKCTLSKGGILKIRYNISP
jgi:Ser-tRNA(Ala) deacylase AlaX